MMKGRDVISQDSRYLCSITLSTNGRTTNKNNMARPKRKRERGSDIYIYIYSEDRNINQKENTGTKTRIYVMSFVNKTTMTFNSKSTSI